MAPKENQRPPFLMESFLYPINEKFPEGMVMWPEVWNLVISQFWVNRLQWDNRMPFGQLQSHWSLCFILCFQGQHNEPSYRWDPMWALSINRFIRFLRASLNFVQSTGFGKTLGITWSGPVIGQAWPHIKLAGWPPHSNPRDLSGFAQLVAFTQWWSHWQAFTYKHMN